MKVIEQVSTIDLLVAQGAEALKQGDRVCGVGAVG